MVGDAHTKGKEEVNTPVSKKRCTECGGRLQMKYIDRDFERGGSTVKLCGIRAWVCQECGEIYFMPGGAQKVVNAVNALFELLEVEKQHGRKLAAEVS